MCSYNRINGIYASENHWLLTEVLRDEWGFDGLVVSDWGAVNDRVASVSAGLDLTMPAPGTDYVLVDAVSGGKLDEAVLDVAVDRVLTLIERTSDALATDTTVDFDAHHRLAKSVALESAVLLKNDGILPLDPAVGTVGLIGEFARTPLFQGQGSSAGCGDARRLRARRGDRAARRPRQLRAGLRGRGRRARGTARRGGRSRALRRHRRRLPRVAGVVRL